jgi:signal transduction histidine kinase
MRRRKGDLSRANTAVVIGMLALIFAQLIWWILFFEIHYRKNEALRIEYNHLLTGVLNGNIDRSELAHLILREESGRHIINPAVEEAYSSEHRRYLWMLISETAFTLIVISYGSLRVVRSIKREHRLIRERNVFLNSVTHELKTPLAGILLNLQTLEKRRLSENSKRELIHDGIEGVRRLEEQINNLLMGGEILHRRESRRNLPDTGERSCDASSLIHRYVEEQRSYLKKCGCRLSLELPETAPIAMDSDLFVKVISNLIGNAVRYSPERPEIGIRIGPDPQKTSICLIRIEDKGYGIPPEELDNIFKPMYRIERGAGPVRGSGMGLYIVREIIESSGGTIRALSKGEGSGSLFELRIPFKKH